ncbi:MAG TPA: hypothetical protein VNU20_01685 [Candidatus Sulfotelmatobacter sp.]|jgi:hypothetical protein|nr:hypothetical protein [Candidatus Sulfotelmatobacter sp.]
MSNLSFARIMYGTSQEAHSPMFGAMSNFPSTIQNTRNVDSQASAREAQGATVESILHKVWIALSEKK